MPTNSHDKRRQSHDTEPRQATTSGDNSHDRATTGSVSVAAMTPPEMVTVEEAAAMLDVSPRTIQRRCQNGKLSAKQMAGEFGEVWEIERAAVEKMATTKRGDKPRQQPRQSAATATTGDDRATTSGVNSASDARAIIPLADERKTADRDTAPDFRARYIAQMEAENSFLKSQLEDANRNAAELRAALRKALEIAPRQLPAAPTDTTTPTNPAPQTAQEAPPIVAAPNQSPKREQSGHTPKEPRPLWKVILGLR